MVVFLLVRILVVSGILLGYYWLFLRNRRQHQFNRFFLLATAICSVLVVFTRFDWILQESTLFAVPGAELLPVTLGAWEDKSVFVQPARSAVINWQTLVVIIYAIGCGVGIVRLWKSIARLRAVKKAASPVQYDSFQLHLTDHPTAPAVFLSTLFWPRTMDPAAAFSHQVLRHEQYHIQQKHGWDIALMEMICIIMWFNPFVHILRKEICLVHEFAADAFASATGTELYYAEQLLTRRLAQKKSKLAISFAQPPLKRRITMLLNANTPSGYGKLARWLALPVAAFVFLSMTVRPHRGLPSASANAARATIVVDAGHGGPDGGAIIDGLHEKDISLAIAKAIATEAKDYNLDIILTRNVDALPGGTTDIHSALRSRSEMGNKSNASLFVSIHVDDVKDEHASVFIPNEKNGKTNLSLMPACAAAGTAIARSMNSVIATRQALKQRMDKGIWVLDNSSIPAVLIECGSLAQETDRVFLSDPAGQQKLARAILNGVQQYLAAR